MRKLNETVRIKRRGSQSVQFKRRIAGLDAGVTASISHVFGAWPTVLQVQPGDWPNYTERMETECTRLDAVESARDIGPPFLFSVDLEDIRSRLPGGQKRPPRVTVNTLRYLDFLDRHRARCTFFVVGELADAEPELIGCILDKGHEVACHSHLHTPLELMDPDGFRRDLEKNLKSLSQAGADHVVGFRAPCFSLTARTAWVYDVLAEFDLRYSSSVLPAPNPIYGWSGFGQAPRKMGRIWEIPISVMGIPGLRVPHSGGVYFRALPMPLIQYCFAHSMKKFGFVTGYFHPYDIDEQEERVALPELNGNRLHHWLFYFNRGNVFRRLETVMRRKFPICRYRDFAAQRFGGEVQGD